MARLFVFLPFILVAYSATSSLTLFFGQLRSMTDGFGRPYTVATLYLVAFALHAFGLTNFIVRPGEGCSQAWPKLLESPRRIYGAIMAYVGGQACGVIAYGIGIGWSRLTVKIAIACVVIAVAFAIIYSIAARGRSPRPKSENPVSRVDREIHEVAAIQRVRDRLSRKKLERVAALFAHRDRLRRFDGGLIARFLLTSFFVAILWSIIQSRITSLSP